MQTFFGKYRGKVVNNFDLKKQGRLQVKVPAVLGNSKLSWAMPCVPYAGAGVGLFMLPPKGANVWVEFEGGDLDYPIWSGCFWGPNELPQEATNDQLKLIKTSNITLLLNDLPSAGGITLQAKSPAVLQPLSLKLDSKGIEISNSLATIKMNQGGIEISQGAQSIKISPANVSINNGALEVM